MRLLLVRCRNRACFNSGDLWRKSKRTTCSHCKSKFQMKVVTQQGEACGLGFHVQKHFPDISTLLSQRAPLPLKGYAGQSGGYVCIHCYKFFPYLCFLTSACAVSVGLPDDCAELQIIREFRDTYVMGLPTGMDEILEYYSISPRIISSISTNGNATEIYHEIFKNTILPCVNFIRRKSYAEAYRLYKKKFHELQARFL